MRRLVMLPEIRNATNIHCYWPIKARRELDTSFLIKQLHAEKKQVVLPVVKVFPTDAPSPARSPDRMIHCLYEGETKMVTNRWGIEEPASEDPFPLESLDAVIVPALGVDVQGNRLGYGKGFYDEFLAQCDCPFICPVYSRCLLDNIPAMSHDIPVDIIVTEHEVHRIHPGVS